MNHLIQTTSLSKIRRERCLLSTLVLLLRMAFTRERFGFANLTLRNYQLTILCRENLRYHRDTSIISKREMILWCLNLIFLKKNIIVLIVLLIVIVINDKIAISHRYANPSLRILCVILGSLTPS